MAGKFYRFRLLNLSPVCHANCHCHLRGPTISSLSHYSRLGPGPWAPVPPTLMHCVHPPSKSELVSAQKPSLLCLWPPDEAQTPWHLASGRSLPAPPGGPSTPGPAVATSQTRYRCSAVRLPQGLPQTGLSVFFLPCGLSDNPQPIL